MKELPSNDGPDDEFQDFEEFEKLVNNLGGENSEPADMPLELGVPGEAGGPELPKDFQLLDGQERVEVGNLIESIEQNISGAKASFNGFTGDYFLHLGEEVTVDGSNINLVRDSFIANDYTLRKNFSEQTDITAVNDGFFGQTAESLKNFEDFKNTTLAIQRGEVKGSHTFTAVKSLIGEPNGAGPETYLFAEVKRQSDGQGSTQTQVELTLQRQANPVDSTIRQTLNVESDPSTGNIRSKSELNSHDFAGFIPVNDPMPELTAHSMQAKFKPKLPVNRNLTTSEWQGLVSGRIGPEHLIQDN